MRIGMSWTYSKNGWYKDSKEIAGKQSKRGEEIGEKLDECGQMMSK